MSTTYSAKIYLTLLWQFSSISMLYIKSKPNFLLLYDYFSLAILKERFLNI